MLFVVDETVPRSLEMTTVPPDAVSKFEYASFNVTVIVDADVPSASIDVGDATTVDVDNDADPGITVTDALVPATSDVPEATVAVIVCAPAVFNVTEKSLVPETSCAFDGSVAEPSDDVIAMVCVCVDTTFQFASTAFTVAVIPEPATSFVGVPDLPDTDPGSAVSPGSNTCNFVAAPAFTVKFPEASESVTEPSVAAIVRLEPAIVGVTDTESTYPPEEMVAANVPSKAFVDERVTVPV